MGTDPSPNITNNNGSTYRVDSIFVNRFEWYPTQAYSVNVPQIIITMPVVTGKLDVNGNPSSILQIINRDNTNSYQYQRTYVDFQQVGDYLTNFQVNFLDVNNNPINFGAGDPNAVSYYLELTITYVV
jgi:hypothetical protein